MPFQETLREWADAFAREVKGRVIPKGAGFAITLGEGWAIVDYCPTISPDWARIEVIYPKGVAKDWRIGTPVETFDFKRTRGWDIHRKLLGKLSLYREDLQKANYRRGSDDEILVGAGHRDGNELALSERVPLGGSPGSAEGGQAARDRREDPGADAVGEESRPDAADAADAEYVAVPRDVPRGLGDAPEGVLVTNERKRKRNTRQQNKLKRLAQQQAELNVGLANWAPPKPGRPKMAFFYVRYSSLEQSKGYSEAMQTEAIERLFQYRLAPEGYEKAPRVYLDAGKSAYKIAFGKRPMGAQLLADVQQGDAILVYKLDRCFRQVGDGAETCELLKERGVRLLACDFDVDYMTATGMLMMNMLNSIAQWESQVKAERTRDGLRSSLRKGKGDPRAMPYFCERIDYRSRRVPVIRPEYVELIDWCAKALRDGWDALKVSKEAAKRAAIVEGRKPCIGETYGFGHDRMKKGLAKQLREWDIDTATRIRVGGEVRYVWMPVKQGVEVEA